MKEFIKNNTAIVLAFLTLGTCFIIISFALFKGYDDTNKDVVMFILGFVCSTGTTIISYYFGSSTGSKAKQDILNKIQDGNNGQPNEPAK